MKEQNLYQRWKSSAEELRLQMHLGSKELSQKFEEEKKEILDWSKKAQENISTEASAKSQELKTKLEELQVQAALGKAETADALKEQEKKLTSLLRDVSQKSQELSDDTSEKFEEFKNDGSQLLEKWQTSFDMLRLQASLGTSEAKEEWAKKKRDFKLTINELEGKLAEAKKEGEENLNNFKKEISESWRHLKNAFTGEK
ncbi:MAG: hypothetical protein AAGC47_03160 [Bacteroidota bacterium]